MTNITHADAYPGYEWVAEIGGDDYLETLRLLERLMKEERIDAYCPGTKSTVAGLLASYRDAARAREIIASDPRLKGRWLAVLDARGSHRIT